MIFDWTTIVFVAAILIAIFVATLILPEEKSRRIMRYLTVSRGGSSLHQVLADQINQPAVRETNERLPGQRVLFYVAVVFAVIAITIGLWAVFWT